MTNILVSTAKAEFFKLDEACTIVQKKVGDNAEITRADKVDWEAWKAEHGGWDAAYKYASKHFDTLVLVLTDEGALGRGQYELGQDFQAAGKVVALLDRDSLYPIKGFTEVGPGADWKTRYAWPVTR